jgi:hypothetical protein
MATVDLAGAESQHPDARWLVSLFPAGEEVTREGMREEMRRQRGDARAMFFVWLLGDRVPGLDNPDEALLRGAAVMGYGPAQAELSPFGGMDDGDFVWAERAARQGLRRGLVELAHCYYHGAGCAVDQERSVELYRQAAVLDCPRAQLAYGWRASARSIGGDTTGSGARQSGELAWPSPPATSSRSSPRLRRASSAVSCFSRLI